MIRREAKTAQSIDREVPASVREAQSHVYVRSERRAPSLPPRGHRRRRFAWSGGWSVGRVVCRSSAHALRQFGCRSCDVQDPRYTSNAAHWNSTTSTRPSLDAGTPRTLLPTVSPPRGSLEPRSHLFGNPSPKTASVAVPNRIGRRGRGCAITRTSHDLEKRICVCFCVCVDNRRSKPLL